MSRKTALSEAGANVVHKNGIVNMKSQKSWGPSIPIQTTTAVKS